MKNALKKLFEPVDMTVGNPVKQVLRFTIPMLIGNFAQQLYNTADSVIVGRFVGDNALAAVGSAMPLLNLMLVLFIGISVGASVMVAPARPVWVVANVGQTVRVAGEKVEVHA
ncbi:MAG: oligosaccharide flippase family protein, partial [Butyrivibrio sp.]|nr:oligosaccharide flippase family protein [Butyrivibrio sp.]